MSKFKGGLDAYKQRQSENTIDEPKAETESLLQNTPKPTSTVARPLITRDKTTSKETKEYQQVNGQVPKQLYKKIKIALVEEERTISDLMTELFSDWINNREKEPH